MGKSAVQPTGRPRNSFKKDFVLYVGGGLGGGSSPTLTPSNRYPFWIDHNRFATKITKLITQNVAFRIYTDALASADKPVWICIDQSNDCPDEIIKASVGALRNNALYIDPALSLPPYYINTNFFTQPTDFNYQNDQGRYVYNGYTGNGLGLGNSGKIVQSFVPQSSLLTAVWLRDLFHVGTSSDHTLYQDLIVEIWDKNKNVIATATINKFAFNIAPGDGNTEYYITADDGLRYWVEQDQIRVKFGTGAKVEVGQTHYICIKQSTSTVSHQYAVGSNTNSAGNYPDPSYTGTGKRYIFGQAYTAPYASTTLTAIGSDISICFTTQRPNGRTCFTFLWDSPGYWFDPAGFPDVFKFIKEDFEQVI